MYGGFAPAGVAAAVFPEADRAGRAGRGRCARDAGQHVTGRRGSRPLYLD